MSVKENNMGKASIASIDKWKKKNISRYSFYVNKNTETDIDEWLKTIGNKRQYFIGLIRKDMDEQLLSSKAAKGREK